MSGSCSRSCVEATIVQRSHWRVSWIEGWVPAAYNLAFLSGVPRTEGTFGISRYEISPKMTLLSASWQRLCIANSQPYNNRTHFLSIATSDPYKNLFRT